MERCGEWWCLTGMWMPRKQTVVADICYGPLRSCGRHLRSGCVDLLTSLSSPGFSTVNDFGNNVPAVGFGSLLHWG